MSTTLVGAISGVGQDVQTDRSALMALKPINPGALGSYQKGLVTGTMAAGLAAASPVYSFRYGGANVARVNRVRASLGDLAGFTAGLVILNMFVARTFTASDSGGTAGTLTGNNAKLRTSFAATGVSDIRISSTGTLTAGTRTLDADPIATLAISAVATAGQPIAPSFNDMLIKLPGDYPLLLATNEGFVLLATVPATGTWQLGVDTAWDELASF
jgi:hypothetical protein